MSRRTLRVTDLVLRHGSSASDAVRDLSFRLDEGDKVALIGRNGSGKTTLLSAIVGLIPIRSGEIEVCGELVTPKTLSLVRRSAGFLFSVVDDQILFPKVFDDVLFGLRASSRDVAESKAREMMERLGIVELADESPHRLSLGQRKRVALAGTLVTEPKLLLLDEPSGGLDPRGRCELARLLSDVDASMLVATHDLRFATEFCDRALVLDGGRKVEEVPLGSASSSVEESHLLEAMYGRSGTD